MAGIAIRDARSFVACANVEVYNVFNTNAVLTENAVYRDATASGWRIPT